MREEIRYYICYAISFAGQARKYSTAGDAAADILAMHPGTGPHDTPHWSGLHDPDRCLQDVQTATVEESQLRSGHGICHCPLLFARANFFVLQMHVIL